MAVCLSLSTATDRNLVWEVPDKRLNEGASGVFHPSNSIFLRPFSKATPKSKQKPKPFFHEIKWSNPLHNRYTRKLVNECHGIFVAADKLTQDVPDTLRAENVLKISKKYRSVLLACMEDLDHAEAAENFTEEDIINQKAMLSEIELVWSLVEVLLFDTQSRSLVLYRLLEWVQWHFVEPSKRVSEIVDMVEPCQHENYWNTVFQLVLQGNISSALTLLRLHQSNIREDFVSMCELLRKMPMYNMNLGMSWNEFLMRWHHWQDECKRRLSQGDFAAVNELECLAKIQCGDKDTLSEKSVLCSTWYHLLISVQLYTDPCVSTTVLGQLARTYSQNLTTGTKLKPLDNIILAVLEFDIITMINNFCSFQDGWWFVSHITDLFYRGNFLDADIVSHSNSLREALILSYAESLMTHDSLWQIGVDYLDRCEEHGREHLELYLERIPLNTEHKARKVLYLAKRRNLDHLAKSICKVMTVKAIKKEMFGTALNWVIHSKDVQFATDLANRWIKEYSETGKFHCFEILKNLGFCMLVSDKLTFLGKYCEFHKLYQEKEYNVAASLLVSLLSSGLVPKPFQMVMLLDALPLLEASNPAFTMQETTQLMSCLEDLSDNTLKDDEKSGLTKKERLIRLALARNLARSFLYENSSSPTENAQPMEVQN